MRFILFILLVAGLSALAESFLPWWMIAVVPFGVALLLKMKDGMSFLGGFLGIAIFWFAAALYKDIPNQHILSKRMAELMHLNDYGLLIFVVSLIGGLVGGLAALSGSAFAKHKQSM